MLASTWSEPNGKGTRTDGVILTGDKVHIMRNNLAFPNKTEYITGYGVDTQFNTWDLNLTPAAKDFLSITDPSVSGTGQTIETTSPALGPRQADGSLPNVDFMKLAAGSAMIDKGTDVKLPFVGVAPDLGAYEYGATGGNSGGTGGATGSGGSTGTGGRTGTGGSTGTGGTARTAGATASGGTPGTGGRPTVGGTTGVGGSSGGGGTPILGGTPGVGGTTVTGGRTGSSATGGAVASGGMVETGGSLVATGGNVATGGAAGGFSASGGAASSSPVPSGGIPATGGAPAPGGTTSTSGPTQESSGGCSCRIARAQTKSYPALLALFIFALRLRKRR
jgi:hypothetical protein